MHEFFSALALIMSIIAVTFAIIYFAIPDAETVKNRLSQSDKIQIMLHHCYVGSLPKKPEPQGCKEFNQFIKDNASW